MEVRLLSHFSKRGTIDQYGYYHLIVVGLICVQNPAQLFKWLTKEPEVKTASAFMPDALNSCEGKQTTKQQNVIPLTYFHRITKNS